MKFLALDIGNVLCDVNAKPFLNMLSEQFNITMPEATRFLKRFQQIHDLGYTTMEDELIDTFHIKSPVILKKLVKSWNDSVSPNFGMLNRLNYMIEKHDVKVALLSNIGTEHASMMETKLSHGRFYNNIIEHFSCYVGARKPSSIFYQSFLLQYPEFKGSLYVDDLQENLNSSLKFGFKTLLLALDKSDVDARMHEMAVDTIGEDDALKMELNLLSKHPKISYDG